MDTLLKFEHVNKVVGIVVAKRRGPIIQNPSTKGQKDCRNRHELHL